MKMARTLYRGLLTNLFIGIGFAVVQAIYLVGRYGWTTEAWEHSRAGFTVGWCGGSIVGLLIARIAQAMDSN
jgi:hypothetical protein